MVLELKTVDSGWLRITTLRWRPFPNPCSRTLQRGEVGRLPRSRRDRGTATGEESAQRIGLVVLPPATPPTPAADRTSSPSAEVQQGAVPGAELFAGDYFSPRVIFDAASFTV